MKMVCCITYTILVYFILVPAEVHNLQFDILNSTSVLVQWSEPTVTNGIITSYEVNISVLTEFMKRHIQNNINITIQLGKAM